MELYVIFLKGIRLGSFGQIKVLAVTSHLVYYIGVCIKSVGTGR